MRNEKRIQELRNDIENAERELKIQNQKRKRLEHQSTMLKRNERTHRLCTHGAMIEKYLDPNEFTDKEISQILRIIFHQKSVMEVMKSVAARRAEVAE